MIVTINCCVPTEVPFRDVDAVFVVIVQLLEAMLDCVSAVLGVTAVLVAGVDDGRGDIVAWHSWAVPNVLQNGVVVSL